MAMYLHGHVLQLLCEKWSNVKQSTYDDGTGVLDSKEDILVEFPIIKEQY